MSFNVKLALAVALFWIAISPPLFTNGQCTAEFEAETKRLGTDQASIRSSALARTYWNERSVPYSFLTPEQCRQRKPRTLDRCADGPLIIARVPVKNMICNLYRDDEITTWLQYDSHDRLSRVQFDMRPYKSLPIPGTDMTIHWAR